MTRACALAAGLCGQNSASAVMRRSFVVIAIMAVCFPSPPSPGFSQDGRPRGTGPMEPIKTERYHAAFVQLGSAASNGLLYEAKVMVNIMFPVQYYSISSKRTEAGGFMRFDDNSMRVGVLRC